MIEVSDTGKIGPGEERRTLLLALDILDAYLQPGTPAELLERNLPGAAGTRAILETASFTRILREVFQEIEPREESVEWLKRQTRFFVLILGLCTAWRVGDHPEFLGEPAPYSNAVELRERLARIRALIDS